MGQGWTKPSRDLKRGLKLERSLSPRETMRPEALPIEKNDMETDPLA